MGLIDVLHCCLINYVVKSHRDGPKTYEIVDTSNLLFQRQQVAFCQKVNRYTIGIFLATINRQMIEQLQAADDDDHIGGNHIKA